MEFNKLSDRKHISKVGDNAYQFAILNELFHYVLLEYKIIEFDVRGALDAAQWDVAYYSSKELLESAVKIFIFYNGQRPANSEYFLLCQLKSVLVNDEDLYRIVEETFYTNQSSTNGMKSEIEKTLTLIREQLVPQEIWKLWGDTKQFNFSSYLESILVIKNAFKNIDKTLINRPTFPIEYINDMHNLSLLVTKGK